MILQATELVVMLVLVMMKGTEGVSDTHGRVFIVSTPALGNSTVQFFVCTWSTEEIKVIFTTSTSRKLIMVSMLTPKATTWKEQIRPVPRSSLRPVYTFTGDHEFSISVMLTFERYNKTYRQETLAIPVAGWGRKYFVTTLWNEPFVVITTSLENIVRIFIRTSGLTMVKVEYKGAYYTDGDAMTINLHVHQGFTLQLCSNDTEHRSLLGTAVDGTNPFGLISGNCAGVSTEQPCNYSESNRLAAPSNDIRKVSERPIPTPKSSGLILDMSLPMESFGTYFVTLPLIPLKQPAYVWVINGEEETQLDVIGCSSERLTYKMLSGKSRIQLDVQNCSHLIHSNKPVQVVYIFGSTCDRTTNATPDATILLPISLFMNYYIWMTPTVGTANIQHYIMLILLYYKYMLEMDGESLAEMDIHLAETVGSPYLVGYLEVSSGPHWMINLLPFNFGLYVAGFSHLFTYVRPVGFISSEIALKCRRSNGTIREGDFIDNDCDGQVDEESKDGDDNDLDDLVDEDVFRPLTIDGGWSSWTTWICDSCESVWKYRNRNCTKPTPLNGGLNCSGDESQKVLDTKACKEIMCPNNGVVDSIVKTTSEITTKTSTQTQDITQTASQEKTAAPTIAVDGEWSAWSEWKCSENCSEKRMIQLRQCDNPPPTLGGKRCDGFPFRYKYGGCEHLCPEECPFGTWGVDCVGSCINCIQECDKFSGRCGNCKEGYQNPLESCNKACGYNSYGADCQGNCLEKCDGQDCLERTIGVCPATTLSLKWLWVLIPIVLIPLMVLFILRFKTTKAVDDKVIIDKMAQIMSRSEVMLFALAEIEQDRRSLHVRRSSKKLHKTKKSKSSSEQSEVKESEVD